VREEGIVNTEDTERKSTEGTEKRKTKLERGGNLPVGLGRRVVDREGLRRMAKRGMRIHDLC